jgi:SAM-dependent methyltransferase
LEPEIMSEDAQAHAYAMADFDEPHSRFIRLFQQTFNGDRVHGFAADLGCGPGDISIRFAHAFERCMVHGIDASPAMLRHGLERLAKLPQLHGRIQLVEGLLPGASLPQDHYEIIISNSLLHHLPNPAILWRSIRKLAKPTALVFIMDLRRPQTIADAQGLTQTYAGKEHSILRRDFFNSLLAAFEPPEIEQQLAAEGFDEMLRVTPLETGMCSSVVDWTSAEGAQNSTLSEKVAFPII